MRVSVGIELFVSTDSSTREYVPPGILFALMFTVAVVKELNMDTQDNSEPVFYFRLIASVSAITSSA